MTKKEFERLKLFIKENSDVDSTHIYLITQQDQFVHNYKNTQVRHLIKGNTVLSVPFNQIRRICFWIHNRRNQTVYF